MKTTKTKKQTRLSTLNTRQATATPELLNRSEQLSGTETQTATTPETATAQEPNSEGAAPSAGGEGKGEVAYSIKPYVNFAERDFNRKLSVEKVLEKLRRWMPGPYALAEVVGKWVWISFPEPPLERVRAELSQLGFHWNNTRKCWQHPCGETLPRGQQEPREKYSVWFPSATEALRQKKARSHRDEVPFDREPVAA